MNNDNDDPRATITTGNNNNNNHRPTCSQNTITEAQLRWAQFRHKRNAVSLREQLVEWYLTPPSPSDVEGAQTDDGNSTSSSSSSSGNSSSNQSRGGPDVALPLPAEKTTKSQQRRHPNRKVQVSRGRRALLRVSQRRYAQRKAWILQHGYRNGCGTAESESDDDHGTGSDDDGALAAIFAEESWRRHQRHKANQRRRRKRTTNGNDYDRDRLQRFEQAYQAVMRALAAAQDPHHNRATVPAPTRVWKRTGDAAHLDFTQWQFPSSRVGTMAPNESMVSHGYHPLLYGAESGPVPLTKHSTETPPASTRRPEPSLTQSRSRLTYRELVDGWQQQLGGHEASPSFTAPPTIGVDGDSPCFDEDHDDDRHPPLPPHRAATTNTTTTPPTTTPRRVLDKFFRPRMVVAQCSAEEKKDEHDGNCTTPAKTQHAPFPASSSEPDDVDNDENENDDEEEQALQLMQQYWPEVHGSSDLLQELDVAQPGLSKQLFQLFLQDQAATPFTARRQLLVAARRHMELHALEFLGGVVGGGQQQSRQYPRGGLHPAMTTTTTTPARDGGAAHNVVRNLVAQLEEALRREPRIWQDGKLHQPAFAQLLRNYLREVGRPTDSRRCRFGKSSSPRRSTDRKWAKGQFDSDDADEDEEADDDDPFERMLRQQDEDESVASHLVEDDGDGDEDDSDAGRHNDESDDNDVFVERLMQQVPAEELVDSSGHVTDRFREMVANYLQVAEDAYSPVRRTIFETQTSEGEPTLMQDEGDASSDATPTIEADDKEFIRDFVKQLHRSSQVEPVFTREGRLVTPALEKFVMRYMQQTAATPKTNTANFFLTIRSPEALARARQQSARKSSHQARDRCGPRPIGLESPAAQRKFVMAIQSKVEQAAPFGTSSTATMEALIENALLEVVVEYHRESKTQRQQQQLHRQDHHKQQRRFANQEPLFDDLDDFVQPFVTHLSLRLNGYHEQGYGARKSPSVNDDLVRQVIESSLPPSVRPYAGVFVDCFVPSFLELFRKSFDGVVDLPMLRRIARTCADSAAYEYSCTTAPSEAVSSEDQGSYDPRTTLSLRDATLSRSFTDTVSEKMVGLGGLFKWNQPGGERENVEELQAVAAFRKSRLLNSSTDDTSSLSSFRVPEGFKKVVQTFRRSGPAASEPTFGGSSGHAGTMEPASEELEAEISYIQNEDDAARSLQRLKSLQEKVLERSSRRDDDDASGSIIDTDGTEVSYSARDPAILSNLLLSPTILTKRLKQAIRAVEGRNWDQVAYLLSANPWLAEMTDMATNQFLLHKVALYGSNAQFANAPCPDELNTDLIRLFPSAVHKFDRDGNLPLHMAAASANVPMVKLLGDRFPSGSSVRNEDGMLPLHLAILALASDDTGSIGYEPDARAGLVKAMLSYFPGAVAVTDNDGNLPLHSAASVLRDDVGVDVVHLLMDEAERQVKLGARFRNKVKIKEPDGASIGTETADSMHDFDEEVLCSLVRNDEGETPLMVAIRSRAGWQLIEALIAGPGGAETVLCQDADLNNALHLLVSGSYKDPKAVMSVLKTAPESARARNARNMIPIEIACRQESPREVLLAIALVDLPFDLDDTECHENKREGCGASWFFLTCECDDAHVDVVEEVISLCLYTQIRELCFFDVGQGETLLARATPKCRQVLQRSLRFLGRFEFVSSQSEFEDSPAFRLFEAIDYGTKDFPIAEGQRVLLKCYVEQDCFEQESTIIRNYDLDFSLLEEVCMFAVGEDGMTTHSAASAKQFCISIEQASLTLEGVLEGLLGNDECRSMPAVRKRYAEKVFAVLRIVAKALRHLHSLGLVHGSVTLRNCAKFEDRWKLGNVLQICEEVDHSIGPPADIWAFGMLAYEVLVGETLFTNDGDVSRLELDWNRHLKQQANQTLVQSCLPMSWADMIVSCLDPDVERRPTMTEVLALPLWKDAGRRQRSGSGGHEAT